MTINVRIDFVSIQRHLIREAGSLRALTAEESSLLLSAAADAEDLIKDAWPVRTGLSRDGWSVYVEGFSMRFYNDVEYAGYVHHAGDKVPLWDELQPILDDEILTPFASAMKAAITRTERTRHTPSLLESLGSFARSIVLMPTTRSA